MSAPAPNPLHRLEGTDAVLEPAGDETTSAVLRVPLLHGELALTIDLSGVPSGGLIHDGPASSPGRRRFRLANGTGWDAAGALSVLGCECRSAGGTGSQTARATGRAGIGLTDGFETMRQEYGRDALAGVRDRDLDA